MAAIVAVARICGDGSDHVERLGHSTLDLAGTSGRAHRVGHHFGSALRGSADPEEPPSHVSDHDNLGLDRFVFIVIGVLAIQIALTDWNGNGNGEDADQEGALQTVADQPFGVALLTATAVGLALFMVWNLAQAFIPDSTGLDLLGIIQRIGWFGLGLFYGFLAFSGLELAWAEANGGEGGSDVGNDDGDPEELTARLFELPGGRWIAGLIAIGVLAVAGYHLYKGVSRQFVDDLDTDGLSDSQETWLGRFGVVGFATRAFVLAATAWFLAQAAVNYDPDEAEGLDGALRELASVVYGQVLLIAVGVGLVLAGGYDMVTFRRQRLR